MSGVFAPVPGRAPIRRILVRQIRLEVLLTLRRGEAVALALAVPLLALLGVGLTDVVRLPTDDRLGYLTPGVIALTVMSVAFTHQAIAVGYERQYGVLKRLGASPLSPAGLLAAKTATVLTLVTAQALVLAAVGVALGWRPHLGGLPGAVAVTALATAGYTGYALLLASRLRPETITGVATLAYTVLITIGGVVFPLPDAGMAELLNPLAAHAEVLRQCLTDGDGVPAWAWNIHGLWAVTGGYAAARGFRWE